MPGSDRDPHALTFWGFPKVCRHPPVPACRVPLTGARPEVPPFVMGCQAQRAVFRDPAFCRSWGPSGKWQNSPASRTFWFVFQFCFGFWRESHEQWVLTPGLRLGAGQVRALWERVLGWISDVCRGVGRAVTVLWAASATGDGRSKSTA